MQREQAVQGVYEAMGLAKEAAGGNGEAAEADDTVAAAGAQRAKKKARRDSGSSAGGAAERSMGQFAEVMRHFMPPGPPQPPPMPSADDWLEGCMVSDEQRDKLTNLLPDKTKPFTPLILSALDAATLAACGLTPFQITAWATLAKRA